MGLVLFGVLGLYLSLAILVVLGAVRLARNQGRSVKGWGWAAALVMFLIPFWDWLPTVAVHQYYCAKDAGFWVYKTLDQWNAENPGAMETLAANEFWPHQTIDGKDVAIMNQRMRLVYTKPGDVFLHRWPDTRELIDTKTHEVLGRYVDFSTSHEKRQAGWSGWKFWLDSEYCPGGENRVMQFGKYYSQFKGVQK